MNKSFLNIVGDSSFVVVLVSVFFFLSCHRNSDSLVGRWTVDKVNVDFHEDIATPEMVKQFGEIEKGNVMVINRDSTLTMFMDGDTLRGSYSFRDGALLWNGEPFGRLEDGVIKTETLTPMGWVRTTYKKALE